MKNHDEDAVALAVSILRSSGKEIEALSLEAIAADAGTAGIDGALEKAARSERREGAFGMEIVGAILIPVLVEAARQFWNTYSKELAAKLGTTAADFTFTKLKGWFTSALPNERREMSFEMGERIRTVGTKRGLKPEDIEALVAATTPDRLSVVFSG